MTTFICVSVADSAGVVASVVTATRSFTGRTGKNLSNELQRLVAAASELNERVVFFLFVLLLLLLGHLLIVPLLRLLMLHCRRLLCLLR